MATPKPDSGAGSTTVFAKAGQRKLSASRFAAAVLLFGLLCLCWAQGKWGQLSPSDFSCMTWTSAAIDDYLSQKQGRPQLVFLGSSLMLVPLGGVDADYLKRPIALPHHHNSVYFQDRYKKLTGKTLTTFNFAVPGEMPSDAYLITKSLLQGDKKPDVIVYGVGPRDFLDNLLPSPRATDPFVYLSRFGNIADHISLICPGLEERFNYELGRLCYLYSNRLDLAFQVERLTNKVLTPELPKISWKDSTALRRQVMPTYKQFEVGEDDCKWQPTTPTTRNKFDDNSADYNKRYKVLKWDTFTTQMTFLSDLLETARQRHIHVILATMPITNLNRHLMSSLSWDAYRHGVQMLAKTHGVTFLDLAKSGQFNDKDFGDTVHLHSGGGLKALDIMAETVAHDRAVQMALRPKRAQDLMPEEGNQPLMAGVKENRL